MLGKLEWSKMMPSRYMPSSKSGKSPFPFIRVDGSMNLAKS